MDGKERGSISGYMFLEIGMEIVKKYCANLGRPINRALLEGRTTKWKKEIHLLQKALLESIPTEENLVVSRFIDDKEANAIMDAGRTYISPIFLSTTVGNIENFLDPIRKNQLILKIPKGTKGIFSDPITKRNEFEFILPYGTKIAVTCALVLDGRKKIYGQVVGQYRFYKEEAENE